MEVSLTQLVEFNQWLEEMVRVETSFWLSGAGQITPEDWEEFYQVKQQIVTEMGDWYDETAYQILLSHILLLNKERMVYP